MIRVVWYCDDCNLPVRFTVLDTSFVAVPVNIHLRQHARGE